MKPENVFIDGQSIKIGDFGLCNQGQIFQDKAFVGSIAFQAPEIHTKKIYSSLTDVYAIGVCFFEMLLGKLPFTANDVDDIIKVKFALKVQDDVGAGVTERTMLLLRRMLEPYEDRRINIAQVLYEVEEILLLTTGRRSSIRRYNTPSYQQKGLIHESNSPSKFLQHKNKQHLKIAIGDNRDHHHDDDARSWLSTQAPQNNQSTFVSNKKTPIISRNDYNNSKKSVNSRYTNHSPDHNPLNQSSTSHYGRAYANKSHTYQDLNRSIQHQTSRPLIKPQMIRIGASSNHSNNNLSNSIISPSPYITAQAENFHTSSKHSVTSDWDQNTPTYGNKPSHQKTTSHFFNEPIQFDTSRQKIKLGSTNGSMLYDSGHSEQNMSSYQLIPVKKIESTRYDPPLRQVSDPLREKQYSPHNNGTENQNDLFASMISRKMSPTNVTRKLVDQPLVRRIEHHDTPALTHNLPLMNESISVQETLRRMQNEGNYNSNANQGNYISENKGRERSFYSPQNQQNRGASFKGSSETKPVNSSSNLIIAKNQNQKYSPEKKKYSIDSSIQMRPQKLSAHNVTSPISNQRGQRADPPLESKTKISLNGFSRPQISSYNQGYSERERIPLTYKKPSEIQQKSQRTTNVGVPLKIGASSTFSSKLSGMKTTLESIKSIRKNGKNNTSSIVQ